MHSIAFTVVTLGLSLTSLSALAQAEQVPEELPSVGMSASVSSTRGAISASGGQSIQSEVVSVKVPSEAPRVEFIFSDRGGTIRHAKLLHERYKRNEGFAPMPGVPDARISSGPIDVVSSWSTPRPL